MVLMLVQTNETPNGANITMYMTEYERIGRGLCLVLLDDGAAF